MTEIHAEQALLPGGWARNVRVSIGADGRIAAVEPDAVPGAGRCAGRSCCLRRRISTPMPSSAPWRA